MKLKHMTVRYTHVPESESTLYYAYGQQDGKRYESVFELPDNVFRMLNAFQIDERVTNGLTENIREVTAEELEQREREMRGEAFNGLPDRDHRNPAGGNRVAGYPGMDYSEATLRTYWER